jgi:hypothetical protein
VTRRILALTIVCVSCAFQLSGAQLITNGGFETGNLSGWTMASQAGSAGNFFALGGTTAPLSGEPTVGPASGSFYALADQTGPAALALIQPFTVTGSVSSVTLSFSLFANSYAAVAVNPAGLDYTAAGANQHARVDILRAGATPFDTGSGVLANFFLGADSGANPHHYTNYTFNITSLVAAGGTFQLRFAEVDNVNFFDLGVDNVSVSTTAGGVPEPSSLLLGGVGVAGIIFLRLKRGASGSRSRAETRS